MSLTALIYTILYFLPFILMYAGGTAIYLLTHIAGTFLAVPSSIGSNVINALSFVSFVLSFFPLSWGVSIGLGLMIVFSETIIYWLKRIWEVIGVILDML